MMLQARRSARRFSWSSGIGASTHDVTVGSRRRLEQISRHRWDGGVERVDSRHVDDSRIAVASTSGAHGDARRGGPGGRRGRRRGRTARRADRLSSRRRSCPATACSARPVCPTSRARRSTKPCARSGRSARRAARRDRSSVRERPTPAGREAILEDRARRGRPPPGRAGEDAGRSLRGGALRPGRAPPRVHGRSDVTFGIAICHEVFRYPEITRALVLAGAQRSFFAVPHYVTTKDGALPARFCDPASPYNEKALLCRALENTARLRRGGQRRAAHDQASVTGIIGPDGALLASGAVRSGRRRVRRPRSRSGEAASSRAAGRPNATTSPRSRTCGPATCGKMPHVSTAADRRRTT